MKTQDGIRDAISSGESTDHHEVFLKLTRQWCKMLATKLPDGTLEPTENGSILAKKAIADFLKGELDPDDDCARPYKKENGTISFKPPYSYFHREDTN